ncbi:MAG: hypothetical protein WCG51_02895 [Elusimicrobiota bacterium]
MVTYTPQFIIGVILIVTNQLFGWGGIVVCEYFAHKTKKKIFHAAGIGIYAVSWGMFLLGTILAGPQGVALIKQLFARYGFITVAALVVIAVVIWFLFRRKRSTPR